MKIISSQQTITRKLPFKAETQINQEHSGQKPSEQKVNSAEKQQESKAKFSFPVLATTIAGTLIPILFIRKHQIKSGKISGFNKESLKNLNFLKKAETVLRSFDIDYTSKEMLMVSSGSVLGGLVGGLSFDKNKERANKIAKVKESVFQMFNVAVPLLISDQIVKFTKKKHLEKKPLVQLATAIIAIGIGMPIAAKISKTINNNVIDKENPDKRKLRIRDAFVHVDDFAGVLVLSGVSYANVIKRVLPFLYGMCGYEAGTKKS